MQDYRNRYTRTTFALAFVWALLALITALSGSWTTAHLPADALPLIHAGFGSALGLSLWARHYREINRTVGLVGGATLLLVAGLKTVGTGQPVVAGLAMAALAVGALLALVAIRRVLGLPLALLTAVSLGLGIPSWQSGSIALNKLDGVLEPLSALTGTFLSVLLVGCLVDTLSRRRFYHWFLVQSDTLPLPRILIRHYWSWVLVFTLALELEKTRPDPLFELPAYAIFFFAATAVSGVAMIMAAVWRAGSDKDARSRVLFHALGLLPIMMMPLPALVPSKLTYLAWWWRKATHSQLHSAFIALQYSFCISAIGLLAVTLHGVGALVANIPIWDGAPVWVAALIGMAVALSPLTGRVPRRLNDLVTWVAMLSCLLVALFALHTSPPVAGLLTLLPVLVSAGVRTRRHLLQKLDLAVAHFGTMATILVTSATAFGLLVWLQYLVEIVSADLFGL